MRKCFITLITLLLAFTACRQEEPVLINDGNRVDLSKLRFNLTIQHPEGATKGIKTDWGNGDKVFLFISGCNTGYLTTSYNGTAWTVEYVDNPLIGASGNLQAVYLPYGNNAHPTYIENDNKWTFDEGTDTYYFYASNVPYTVETIGAEQIFSATIQMVKPMTYVQFYIPFASASGTIQLACNALRPAVITGISASNGAVTVDTGTAGTPVTGYADTLAGEEGYYVSGIPVIAASETADYYFALKIGDDYSHYYKNRASLAPNKAYQLPSYSSWPRVGGSQRVMVANGSWKTVNEGAEHPWDLGELKDNSFVPSSGEDLPDETDWSNLIDSQKATWMPMDIWGSHGSLVLSVSASNKYIYIPWSGSVTNYWMAGFANSFHIADNGTTLVIPNPASIPGSGLAYVRTIEKVVAYDGFTIEARTAGTIIKFRYGTSGSTYVQCSTDGSNWSNYTANAAITLTNVGDKVSFRTNMSTLGQSNSSPKALFTSKNSSNQDVSCYVYGELMYLLCDKVGDVWTPRTTIGNANFQRTFWQMTWLTLKEGKKLTLNVNTVGQSGCKLMFKGCTGFTETPIDRLPATSFESGTNQAYASMFEGCSSMTTAPELPATTLGTSCYLTMFSGCSSLTESPVLPAPTIATTAYQGMFQNCSKLKKITCLATSGMGTNTSNWVSGVATSGTFIKASSADWGGTGAARIPSGWTVENYSE